MTLKEQAWQSDLFLSDETAEWNENDWPPLQGGWRYLHATVVLDHLDKELHNDNNKAQIVVVLGGIQQRRGYVNSILLLNLADPDKQWREGPPMNQKRAGHAAVVCNGGIYVMGGDNGAPLDCIEQIDADDILTTSLTSSTAHESHWTTLTCRLSTPRWGCAAVAVHNRYIVVLGGRSNRCLSSVDIIDINNHTVTAGPSMTVPRQWCASAVIGHCIYVVGGETEHGHHLDSVEYVDFAKSCYNDETKKEIGSTFISFSSSWTTPSELVPSNARRPCAMAAVGSCLVVAGGRVNSTVEVLDTNRNLVWNLPPLRNFRRGCSMVTAANQVTVIGGEHNPTCATLPLMDKNSWCFRRLCEQQLSGWYHFREGMGISSFSTSTSKSE